MSLFLYSRWRNKTDLLTLFISNYLSLYVVVNGRQSKLVNVMSGVLSGSVLGLQLFLLFTPVIFSILDNKIYN